MALYLLMQRLGVQVIQHASDICCVVEHLKGRLTLPRILPAKERDAIFNSRRFYKKQNNLLQSGATLGHRAEVAT